MRIQSLFSALKVSCFLILLCAVRPALAESHITLADILDPNGQISNPNQICGTVDFSGYIPVIDDCRGLIFIPAALAPGWNALGTGANATVLAVAVSGSDVYVGGGFTDVGGIAAADRIARWDGSSWNALGSGLNGDVAAIAISGSDVYVGGEFSDAGGITTADRIARWDGAAWNAMGSGTSGGVFAIAVSGSDVYAGGSFGSAGGVGANRIARWNGSAWSAMGGGLPDYVFAIAVSGSDVYAVGYFNYLARWNGSSWSALGAGLNNHALAVAVSGGSVFVGGRFTDAGGVSAADYIARWDGSAWNAVGSGLSNWVYSLVASGSDVYAGGWLNNAGGNASADWLARWDGSAWNDVGGGPNGVVRAIALSGSDVYVVGDFENAGGNSNADRIARWEATSVPVTLLSFQARVIDKTAKLEWRTGSESDNEGWNIEHSTDARNWQTIGFVKGNGNANQENSYQFTHLTPASGQNYYRLLQMDLDGASSYSPVATARVDDASGISVYPTVTSGAVFVKYLEGPVTRIIVVDAMGRVQAQAENTDQIDLSDKAPGTYVIQIEADGKWGQARIVKE